MATRCDAGVHAEMPGAAKAALLARSRIPRAPLPPHPPQQQLQHQSQCPSHGPAHRPGTTSQPQGALSAATTQDLPLSPHPWQQQQQQHQPMQNTHHSPYAARPPVMFLQGCSHTCRHPACSSCVSIVPSVMKDIPSKLVQPLAADMRECVGQLNCLGKGMQGVSHSLNPPKACSQDLVNKAMHSRWQLQQ